MWDIDKKWHTNYKGILYLNTFSKQHFVFLDQGKVFLYFEYIKSVCYKCASGINVSHLCRPWQNMNPVTTLQSSYDTAIILKKYTAVNEQHKTICNQLNLTDFLQNKKQN